MPPFDMAGKTPAQLIQRLVHIDSAKVYHRDALDCLTAESDAILELLRPLLRPYRRHHFLSGPIEQPKIIAIENEGEGVTCHVVFLDHQDEMGWPEPPSNGNATPGHPAVVSEAP